MVFSNNLLFGAAAAASSGAASFDTTLIGNSVWLDGSADGLTKPASEFDNEDGKEFTLGTWFQLTEFGVAGALFCAGNGSGTYTSLRHAANNKIYLQTEAGSHILSTTALFRDIGWYHVLVSVDTTQATDTNRVRMFINGVEAALTGTYPALNHAYDFNLASVHEVGDSYENGAFEGYLAQSFMIGTKSIQQGDFAITDFLDSFTLGTNGSQYVPKKNSDIVTLTAAGSDNSFLLDYANSSDLGNDTSGYNNDFTPTDMDADNQTGSSPSSAFATWNPLRVNTQTQTFAEGNLRFSSSQTSTNPAATGNYGVSSGKWYWEVYVVAQGNTSNMLGICDVEAGLEDDTNALYASSLMYSYEFAGTKRNNNSSASYGDAIATNDIVGIALDMDNGGVYFSKNGTFQASGDPTSGSSLTNAAFTGLNSAGSGTFQPYYLAYANGDGVANFGQSPTFNGQTTAGGNTDANGRGNFKYSVPSGYKALTSANLSAPDYQGIDYFAPTLYEGNGRSQRVGDFVPFTDAFDVSFSAMFDDDDERFLSRTYSASDTARSSNSQATISFWIKVCFNGGDQEILSCSNSSQSERFRLYINDQSGQQDIYMTLDHPSNPNRDFRIPISYLSESEWVNIVYNIDVDNGTAADKIKAWVNGVQVTSTVTTYQSASNADYFLFANEEHMIGNLAPLSAGYADSFPLNSYLSEFQILDGQLKAPTDFGQVDTATNRWVPKDYKTNVGAYGNRGFYMAFASPTGTGNGVGTDTSGNGFNFAEKYGEDGSGSSSGSAAWSTSDQFSDTPSKNFPTFDPTNNGAGTLSEGNTKIVSATNQRTTYTTMPIPATGQWYWEVDAASYATGGGSYFGVVPASTPLPTNNPSNGFTDQVTFETHSGNSNFYSSSPNGGTTWCNTPGANSFLSSGDVLQFAYDASVGTLFIGNNNTWYRAGGARDTFANATTVAGSKMPTGISRRFLYGRGGSYAETYLLNFGQVANTFSGSATSFNAASGGFFVYTPPTGYKALNQDNLDDTASKITAFAWIKNRDAADNQMLFDRVRGVGNDLHSNDTAIEVANANTVQRFLQRGVQVGSDVEVNTASESYVLWQWLLGDSATTGTVIPASGSNPTLASTSLASDNGSFGICTYTGDTNAGSTVKHSLDGIPEMILFKRYGATTANWMVYHKDAGTGNSDYLMLDTYGAKGAVGAVNFLNATIPTSTLVTLGDDSNNNASDTNVMYLFRSIAGVCKVGSYVGNGDANGSYISTGFKPSYVLAKSTGAERWILHDTARSPINAASKILTAETALSEATLGTTGTIDILSDGFKCRDTDGRMNGTGVTYIYLAMAEIGGNGILPPVYGQ